MPPRKGSMASSRLTDEVLEYYGNLYVQHGIRDAGVEFESFLSNPEYWLDRHTGGRWRGGTDRGDGRRSLAAFLRLRRQPRDSAE